MKKTYSISIVLFAIFCCSVEARNNWSAELKSNITYDNAYKHLKILSSDEMLGRDTPSPELEKSAEYIAGELKSYGVQPINGHYFHTYYIRQFDIAEPTELALKIFDSIKTFKLKHDFIPFSNTGEANIGNADIVFAGFGWQDSSKKYDDFEGIDIKGKVVVMIGGSPAFGTARQITDGEGRERGIRTKVEKARALGAVGVFIFSNPLMRLKLRPVGYPFPSLYKSLASEKMPIVYDDTTEKRIPVIHCGERIAESLFGSVDKLKTIIRIMDSTNQPNSFILKSMKTVRFSVTLSSKRIPVRNVMGIVNGSKKSNEYIVIGAHYDHVGYSSPNNKSVDSIFNGADDNASGTTALLLLAKSFSTMPVKPDRSIVFVAFSGEEKGLYGSKAFTDNPPLSMQDCVAMFNMDMVGRNDSNSISVGGSSRCPELAKLSENENAKMNRPFTVKYDAEHFFFRSDQANFAKKKIPVLFYFSGEHSDYHKVTDEITKINFDKLLRITELCGKTVISTANLDYRLPYIQQKGDEQ